eukprot:gene6470-9346_t
MSDVWTIEDWLGQEMLVDEHPVFNSSRSNAIYFPYLPHAGSFEISNMSTQPQQFVHPGFGLPENIRDYGEGEVGLNTNAENIFKENSPEIFLSNQAISPESPSAMIGSSSMDVVGDDICDASNSTQQSNNTFPSSSTNFDFDQQQLPILHPTTNCQQCAANTPECHSTATSANVPPPPPPVNEVPAHMNNKTVTPPKFSNTQYSNNIISCQKSLNTQNQSLNSAGTDLSNSLSITMKYEEDACISEYACENTDNSQYSTYKSSSNSPSMQCRSQGSPPGLTYDVKSLDELTDHQLATIDFKILMDLAARAGLNNEELSEVKSRRRRLKNRLSARICSNKKREKCSELEETNKKLMDRVKSLASENSRLQNMNAIYVKDLSNYQQEVTSLNKRIEHLTRLLLQQGISQSELDVSHAA